MCEGVKDCAICYEVIVDECRLPCSHWFCSNCIVSFINNTISLSENDEGNDILLCPICRREVNISDITRENGDKLFFQPTTIIDGAYIQCETEGLASYHFPSIESSYISYESPECLMWPTLDDGSRPPPRKYFINPSYNEGTKTFRGDIDWSPTKWDGEMLWRYKMVFSEDFLIIESGNLHSFDTNHNGNLKEVIEFGIGQELDYTRKKKYQFAPAS
jgi:RING-finger-containing E3 ubiquitin ligase